MRTPTTIGVIGIHDSSDAIIRAFQDLPQAELRWIHSLDVESQFQLRALHPSVQIARSIDDLLNDETLDAIALATPAATHFDLIARLLAAEKHVFLEPPLALSTEEGEELLRSAVRVKRQLMVADMLRFDPATERLRQLITDGFLGDLYYLACSRAVTPPDGRDVELIWNVAARELSVLLHLVGDEPIETIAVGDSYLQPDAADVLFCHLRFATGITARLDLSRLERQQRRRLAVVSSLGAVVIDERDPEHRFTIYGHVRRPPRGRGRHYGLESDRGEIVSLLLADGDPVQRECEAFLSAVQSASDSRAAARSAVGVVAVLESLQSSLNAGGAATAVPAPVVVPAAYRAQLGSV